MDRSKLFSGPQNMDLRVWDATTGDLVSEYWKLYLKIISTANFTNCAKDITVLSDGQWLAEVDSTTLWVLNMDKERLQAVFRGHRETMWSIVFLPNAKQVVSGSNTIHVCNIGW